MLKSFCLQRYLPLTPVRGHGPGLDLDPHDGPLIPCVLEMRAVDLPGNPSLDRPTD